jgi:hypothetical protein
MPASHPRNACFIIPFPVLLTSHIIGCGVLLCTRILWDISSILQYQWCTHVYKALTTISGPERGLSVGSILCRMASNFSGGMNRLGVMGAVRSLLAARCRRCWKLQSIHTIMSGSPLGNCDTPGPKQAGHMHANSANTVSCKAYTVAFSSKVNIAR